MAMLHLHGSEIWGAGWSQGEAASHDKGPGRTRTMWSPFGFLASPPWFGLTAKMGMWRPEGQGYWRPRPPSRAEPPSVALGPPGALCGVTVSAPSPPHTPGHSVPETHPAATPDEQVPRHVKAHTLHAELWV